MGPRVRPFPHYPISPISPFSMPDGEPEERLTREVKAHLDNMVVGIELTLISIIQGLALGVLAGSAVRPLLDRELEYWPYITTGLLVILIFWSRSLIHTI